MGLTLVIQNHTITDLNTEEVIVLPQSSFDIIMRLRNPAHSIQIATRAGQSNTEFITLDSTLPALTLEDIDVYKQKLYVRSPDFATLEIIVGQD